EREHDQHRHVEDQDASRDRLHGHLADRAADHHRRPDRRRQQADPEIEDHDDAEVNGVDAEGLDGRQEDWRADQQHRRQVHEGAEHQEQDVDPQQEHVLVARDVDEELGGNGGNAQDRHHVAEGDREADHDHDHSDRAYDARDQLRQVAPFAVAVNEPPDEEGGEAGACRRLRRGEYAAQNSPEDDRDRDHSPDRVERDLERLAQRDHLALRKLLTLRNDENEHDQRESEQQGRNDSAHEKMGN